MALANKYRPTTLDSVVGQKSIIDVLHKQMLEGKVAQGILLCGPAGTGKTTVARILAEYLGAEIYELDAASNNGVDDVRTLQEQATRKSMVKDNKVFILDECHAMSTQAWQAMLKILEEPPKNAYFILCTTEINKIPKTILSRVEKFYFTPISDDDIYERLLYVCEAEMIGANKEALEFIANKANGCMRDALSMLDVASSKTNKLTLNSCVEALNEVTPVFITDFVTAVANKHINQAVRIVKDVYNTGMNVKSFIRSCISCAIAMCEEDILENHTDAHEYSIKKETLEFLLDMFKKLSSDISDVEYIEARLIIWCFE